MTGLERQDLASKTLASKTLASKAWPSRLGRQGLGGMRDARGIGSRLVFGARRFRVQLGGCGDNAIDEPGRGASRRSGERLTKRPRLLKQRLRVARRCEQLFGGHALTVRPARHVLPEPIDQIFEFADVHRPPDPAFPGL